MLFCVYKALAHDMFFNQIEYQYLVFVNCTIYELEIKKVILTEIQDIQTIFQRLINDEMECTFVWNYL